MRKKFKILCFFGTRPEAIKMAPVVARLQEEKRFQLLVAVSAQHRGMLDQVLKNFKIKSHIDLDLMRPRQTLTDITSRVIQRFEPVLQKHKPDLVLVHGDTTTTLGGTLASYYQQIPVGHVEAGLRTHDLCRPFPEEANRQLTDTLATLHFCPTTESKKNLDREGRNKNHIFVTGNTVIDALLQTVGNKRSFEDRHLKKLVIQLQREGKKIILMTAHRRENFGEPFERVLHAAATLARRFRDVHWIYPVHPNPNVFGPAHKVLQSYSNIHLMNPIEYTDLVQVMNASTLVVTDSGGLQEEAPTLGKPVLVLRDVTERPEAVKVGTVRLVGTNEGKIIGQVSRLLTDQAYYRKMANAVNPYGDGKAAKRIKEAIRWYFGLARKKPMPFGKNR